MLYFMRISSYIMSFLMSSCWSSLLLIVEIKWLYSFSRLFIQNRLIKCFHRLLDRNSINLFIFNSEDSFTHLKDWLEEARRYSRPEATFMILGNKRDLSINGERQVEFLTSSQFAQENDCLLFETSALTGENVENAFYKIV